MQVTLVFPSYLTISDFLHSAGNIEIDMDLKKKTLTSDFTDEQIKIALTIYHAKQLTSAINKKGN